MVYETTAPRRRLRLPQLSKHYRRQRKHGAKSEFILMCQRIEAERPRYRWERAA